MRTKFKKDIIIYFIISCLIYLIVYSPLIFSKSIKFGLGDHYYQFLPDYKILSESLNSGFLPLWTDDFGNGFPIASYGINNFLHPIHLLIAYIFPDLRTGNLILYFLVFMIGIGSMFLTLKSLNIKNIYSFMGAVIYVGSYHFFPIGVTYSIQMAYMLSPIIFFLFYKVIFKPTFKTSFILGILGGLTLLAFYPAYHLRFFGFLTLISIVMSLFFIKDKTQPLFFIFFSVFVMLLISYPQIKITYELVKISSVVNKTPDYYYIGSLQPSSFFNLFGNLFYSDFIDKNINQGWIYFKLSNIYVYLSIFSIFYKEKKIYLFFMGNAFIMLIFFNWRI